MARYSLTFFDVCQIIEKLQNFTYAYEYELLTDEPIDGAEFLDEMQPILAIMKKTIE